MHAKTPRSDIKPPPPAKGAFFVSGLALLLIGGCTVPPPAPAPTPTSPPPQTAHTQPHVEPFAFDPAEEAGVPDACIGHVMTFPLLTRNGSPAIAVTINDIPGAAYLSPTQGVLGVFDSDRFTLPDGAPVQITTIAQNTQTFETTIATMRLAQGVASKVPAIKLGDIEDVRIAGRTPLGVIGFDILGNYDVLLDMPRQRAMMFRPTNAPGCPPLDHWIPNAHTAQLLTGIGGDNNTVGAFLDNHPLGLLLEPGSNVSIISHNAALDAGLTANAARLDDDVRTSSSKIMLGTRHRFAKITIGDWQSTGFDANVEPALYDILGLPFFRHRLIIMGFLSDQLVFSDAHPDLLPPDNTRAEPSPLSSHLMLTGVGQGP